MRLDPPHQEGLMATSSELIQQLKSRKWGTRFEACEFLRVSARLSTAARSALDAATHDPDPRVAEAAQDALRAHADDTGPEPVEEPPFHNGRWIVARIVVTLIVGIPALRLVLWCAYNVSAMYVRHMADSEGIVFVAGMYNLVSCTLFVTTMYVGLMTLISVAADDARASARRAAENRPEG